MLAGHRRSACHQRRRLLPSVDAAPAASVIACCRPHMWLNSSFRRRSAVVLPQLLTPPPLLTDGLSSSNQ
nr:unnamed protein product [Digitaria exilis]